MSAEAEVAARWKELTEQKDKAELLWYFLQEQDAGAAVNKVNTQIAAREADLLQGRGELQKLTTQIEVLKEDVRVKREAADKAREAACRPTRASRNSKVPLPASLPKKIHWREKSPMPPKALQDVAMSAIPPQAVWPN